MMINYEEMLLHILDEPLDKAAARAESTFDMAYGDDKGRPIVLYGADMTGSCVVKVMLDLGYNVVAFSDRNTSLYGGMIEGIPILSPSDVVKKFGDNFLCVITTLSMNAAGMDKLTEWGFEHVVYCSCFAWKYQNVSFPTYIKGGPMDVLPYKDAVLEAYSMLEDEKTKKMFVEQLSWWVLGDPNLLDSPYTELQYFPKMVREKLKPGMVVVDCGAFDGDTLKSYLSTNPAPVSDGSLFYYAFEPDSTNYGKLSRYIGSLPSDLKNGIVALEKAVSDRLCTVTFDAGKNTVSSINLAGTQTVDCVTIDSVLKGSRCDLIKMDVEGSEKDALAGARETITKNKPILAICVYHKPRDFFDMILLARDIMPSYKLFMDKHREGMSEVVFYALPN